MPADPLKSLGTAELSQLGGRLQRLTQSGISAKGDLPIRWAANESFYDDAPPSSNDSQSKMVKLHINFLSNRVKMLTSMVCGVIGRQQPYMLAKDMQSGDRSERLEKCLHFFWQRAKFEEKLRNISTIAANTNKAVWKLWYRPYDADKAHKAALTDMGVVLEAIHPDNWVCVPAMLGDLSDAKLCGNRFFRRRRWITDRIQSGEFIDPGDDSEVNLVAGDVESGDESRSILRSKSDPQETGGEKDDDQIEVWDLAARLDLEGQNPDGMDSGKKRKGEQLYRILLAIESAQVLLIEPLEYSRPMYFESFYEADEKNYWSGRSVSYSLQGLQETYNLLFSALYEAVMTEALPLVIGAGLPEKFTRYQAGDVINLDNMVQTPWSPPSRFSGGQSILASMGNIERIGDQTARISQNTMGSDVSGSTTATEQSIIAQGVSNGQEEYISNLASPLSAMAAATMELLDTHWDDWCKHFCIQPVMDPTGKTDPQTGQPMPMMDDSGKPKMTGMLDIQREDLDAPVLWEQTGKTPGNTPQAKMQAAQMLMQAAQVNPNTGGDVYELFKVLVEAADLNADGVQANKQDMPWQQLSMQLQQSGLQPEQVMQIIQQAVQELQAHMQQNPGDDGAAGASAMLPQGGPPPQPAAMAQPAPGM